MIDDRHRNARALTALLLAGLLGIAAVGCGAVSSSVTGSIPASGDLGLPDDGSAGIDEPVEEESPFGELPTLAPIPDSVKASAACDKAYAKWMAWWQASVEVVDPEDPTASVPELPAGDPDKIERAVFDDCSLVDLAAANRDHPIALGPDESPVPYIDDTDVIEFVAEMCEDDSDLVGDAALCQALPSPMP